MSKYSDGYWWSNDGLRLHYRDYAGPQTRPAILCLPGLTRNARDYEVLAEQLAGDWRVLCPEFRGRGDSAYAKDALTYVPLTYAQDVGALLDTLGITRFAFVGTSLGGIVGLLVAAGRVGEVAGALLNDIGPDIEAAGLTRIRGHVGRSVSYPTWVHAARAVADGNAAIYPRYELSDWITLAKRWFHLTSSGRIVPDYDMRIAEPLRLPGGAAGVDLWPALLALRDVPTLLLRGALSDVLAIETLQRMREGLNRAEGVTIADVGHAPTLDEPEATTAIARWLEQVR